MSELCVLRKNEMNILKPNRTHNAISRGVGTFILAGVIYGVIMMFFFPAPASVYPDAERDEGGEIWKGLIVLGSAGLTGYAEARRYLNAERMKEEPAQKASAPGTEEQNKPEAGDGFEAP